MTPSTALASAARPASPGPASPGSASSRPASPVPETVLRCRTTADFLAALPFLAGFTAQNSLFVVRFSGQRSRDAMRLDLPPADDPAAMEGLLDAVCRILEETGAGQEGSAIVIASGQGFAEAGGVPWRRSARTIRRRFRARGWPLRELAVVAPDGWAGLLGDERARRRPLSEISASPVTRPVTDAVGPPVPLQELGRLPQPDPRRGAAVTAHLAELDRHEHGRRDPRALGGDPAGTPVWLSGISRVAGACFAFEDELPEPRLCARLIRAAERSDQWLILALVCIARPEFVIDLAEAEPSRFVDVPVDIDAGPEPGPKRGWSIRRLLFFVADLAPDPARLRRVTRVIADAAAHAPAARRHGLVSLLAWVWWMLGLQSVAMRILDEAADPESELVRMVARLIAEPPAWQLERRRG